MIKVMSCAPVSLQLAGAAEEGSINLPSCPEGGALLSFATNIKQSILRR
jgi:hypothetical protein